MSLGQLSQPRGERSIGAPSVGERSEQIVERAVLAEEQQLVLATEVVVEVARRKVGGVGDVPHTGDGEAARAKNTGGGLENLDAAGVGSLPTA